MNDDMKVSWETSVIRMIEERLKSEAPLEYKVFIKLDTKWKIAYIKANWNKLDFGYDERLLKDINLVLHPLLEKVVTEDVNKEIIENHRPKSFLAMHNIFEFRIILEKYANNIKSRSFEEETRLALPYYLLIVESAFTASINLLVYLLIKDGVKSCRGKRSDKKEHVSINSFKKISKETLYNKLTFLKDNGFEVITDVCDRDLRNSIAHMEFIVLEDGSVAYENKTIKKTTTISPDTLVSKIERLLNVCQCIVESRRQFYKQRYGFT